MCAEGALHGITAGAGKAETRGQAVLPLGAARGHAYIPDTPAAQWNELCAFFVGKYLKTNFSLYVRYV